uniref:clotting factor C-like isoform X1 n=1 Tax=Styela clava TaxID=7725 RepID=UPI00193ADE5C|nr:clotting factor C-like isoform X1 [Styela clava]
MWWTCIFILATSSFINGQDFWGNAPAFIEDAAEDVTNIQIREPWRSWSRCDRTCDSGIQTRTRSCITTSGRPCTGRETRRCSTGVPCTPWYPPLHDHVFVSGSQWNTWGRWQSCSVQCGEGIKIRRRSCQGESCFGRNQEQRPCFESFGCSFRTITTPTPALMKWSTWSECSVTCGIGQERSTSECKGGRPKCPMIRTRTCVMQKCPEWGDWENWMECSASCGNGIRLRRRFCENKFGTCPGKTTDLSQCNVKDCNEDSEWNLWGEWTKCTVTCGGGIRRRKRTCKGRTDTCKGSNSNISHCNIQRCQTGIITDCANIEVPQNGKMIGKRKRYRPGNKLRFACSNGYTISGTEEISCQANGQWTKNVPICTKNKAVKCKPIKSLPNGFVTMAISSLNSIVNFECDYGYILNGPVSITCNNKNGEWSKNPPSCTAKSCYKAKQFLEHGRKCRKSCDKRSQCNGISKDCLCDDVCGKSCFDPEKILCEVPKPPENGFVHFDDRTYGHFAEYSCEPGYSLSGTERKICRSDGKWSGNKTRCLKFDTCGQAGDIGSMFSTSVVGARVLAGNSAIEGAWPWQAMIVLNKDNDVTKSLPLLKGGGAIVNNQWILTAAHIFADIIAKGKTNAEEHLIILGLTVVKVQNKYSISKNSRVFESTHLIIHPKYKHFKDNFDYDVAMMRIGKQLGVKNNKFVEDNSLTHGKIPFSLYIRPICLPCAKGVGKALNPNIREQFSDDVCGRRKTIKSELAAVIGYGTTSNYLLGGANVLQQGTLRIAENKICNDALKEINQFWRNKIYTSRMLCAVSGKRNSVVDACYGDSGGPLVKRITAEDGTEYWTQIGIVSWGFGCGEKYDDNKQYPGYFTKVSSVMPFIIKTMKEISK